MKYANTMVINDMIEIIVTILPLARVPLWNHNDPPPFTYLVPDEVELGWVKEGETFIPPTAVAE